MYWKPINLEFCGHDIFYLEFFLISLLFIDIKFFFFVLTHSLKILNSFIKDFKLSLINEVYANLQSKNLVEK